MGLVKTLFKKKKNSDSSIEVLCAECENPLAEWGLIVDSSFDDRNLLDLAFCSGYNEYGGNCFQTYLGKVMRTNPNPTRIPQKVPASEIRTLASYGLIDERYVRKK